MAHVAEGDPGMRDFCENNLFCESSCLGIIMVGATSEHLDALLFQEVEVLLVQLQAAVSPALLPPLLPPLLGALAFIVLCVSLAQPSRAADAGSWHMAGVLTTVRKAG